MVKAVQLTWETYRCAAVLQTAHQAADHHTSIPVILQMLDLDLDTHFVVCWRKLGRGGRVLKKKKHWESVRTAFPTYF